MAEEKQFIEPISDREKFEINERISKDNVEIARLQLENARLQLEIVKARIDGNNLQRQIDTLTEEFTLINSHYDELLPKVEKQSHLLSELSLELNIHLSDHPSFFNSFLKLFKHD